MTDRHAAAMRPRRSMRRWILTVGGVLGLAWSPVFLNGREDPLTNLDKINPEIVIFERRPALH